MNVARLAARVTIGGLFVGHGAQKLKGWFGGPGLEGTEGMMKSLEMHPPRRNALAAGVTEVAGGTLLALGLATPLACASLIGTMITAIRKVHLPQGPWAAEGGYEYNLVLIAALLALAEEGPGDVSLDAALGSERTGGPWALAALALGAGASTASIELGRRSAPDDGQHRAADGSGSTADSGEGTRESVGPTGT
jgi:putative oxidoreductase